MNTLSRLNLLTCLLLLGSLGSGCATLKLGGNPSPSPDDQAEQFPRYTVLMPGSFGNADVHEGQLDRNKTVQEVLEESRATKKWRSMEIVVMRPVEGGRMLRLPVEYETMRGQVKVEQDYAIRPGDQIYVRPRGGPIDGLVNSLTRWTR